MGRGANFFLWGGCLQKKANSYCSSWWVWKLGREEGGEMTVVGMVVDFVCAQDLALKVSCQYQLLAELCGFLE